MSSVLFRIASPYHAAHRKVYTKYADSIKTIVTQTTWICVEVGEICGKNKAKTPMDEFITIRSNYSFDLIMSYKFVEKSDVCTERPPTCDWMDFILMDRKKDSLYIWIVVENRGRIPRFSTFPRDLVNDKIMFDCYYIIHY